MHICGVRSRRASSARRVWNSSRVASAAADDDPDDSDTRGCCWRLVSFTTNDLNRLSIACSSSCHRHVGLFRTVFFSFFLSFLIGSFSAVGGDTGESSSDAAREAFDEAVVVVRRSVRHRQNRSPSLRAKQIKRT